MFGNLMSQQTRQRSKKRWQTWDIISSTGSSSSSPASTPTTASQFNELHTYLHADFSILDSDDDDFDILKWWKKRQPKFLVLSQLARDILTIPVSTVSSESAFSTAGRILEERRTSLTSDMVEVLTCLRDWEHTRKRMQYTTHNEELVDQFQSLYVEEEDVPSTNA